MNCSLLCNLFSALDSSLVDLVQRNRPTVVIYLVRRHNGEWKCPTYFMFTQLFEASRSRNCLVVVFFTHCTRPSGASIINALLNLWRFVVASDVQIGDTVFACDTY